MRLVVVSNRVTIPERHEKAAAAGLAVALREALEQRGGLWFGWSGSVGEGATQQVRQVQRGNVTYAVTDAVATITLDAGKVNVLSPTMQQNIALLRERNWIDIPIVYDNDQRAILTLEKGTPGLSFGARERKMGWNAQPTAQVTFDQVVIPAANRIGEEGEGFRFAMMGLDGGRLNIASCSLGGAALALDTAKAYLAERQQFGRPLKDFQPDGNLDVTGVLRKSSNIGAAKIAVLLGDQRVHRYLSAYGLGRPTGIEVPGEESGILNPVEKWAKIDVTRIAMGHSVAVTALQMLNILCCIGNDGFLMKSHVVRKVVDRNGVVLLENKPEALARPITERTAALMRQMLAEVTREGGTGTRAAVAGYSVAGKTGSAEKIVDGRYVKNANMSSFMGLLPAERPEIGIIVVLDNPTDPATGLRTGGITAAPVFAKIAEPVARYLDIRPLDAAEMVYYQKILDGAP